MTEQPIDPPEPKQENNDEDYLHDQWTQRRLDNDWK